MIALTSVARKYAVRDPEEDLKLAYDLFNCDDSGEVTADRLAEVFASAGEEVSESTLLALMQELDADGDGVISLSDFKSGLLEAYSLDP